MASARWFHAALAGKNGRVQLPPELVPESAACPESPEDPVEPEEPEEPEDEPEPDPLDAEDELAPEDPPELDEPIAPELFATLASMPCCVPPSEAIPLPLPHARTTPSASTAVPATVRILQSPQTPLTQTFGETQTVPHAPQLLLSVCVFVQVPPQSV